MPMGTAVAQRSTLAANFGRGPTSAPQYFLQLFLGNWLLPKYAFKELLSARTSEAQ